MKASEFRNLIREEIRKAIAEAKAPAITHAIEPNPTKPGNFDLTVLRKGKTVLSKTFNSKANAQKAFETWKKSAQAKSFEKQIGKQATGVDSPEFFD